MKAVRFVAAGHPAQTVELPTPQPGPGQVLVRCQRLRAGTVRGRAVLVP